MSNDKTRCVIATSAARTNLTLLRLTPASKDGGIPRDTWNEIDFRGGQTADFRGSNLASTDPGLGPRCEAI